MISDEERREVAKRLRNGGIARDSEEAYVLLLSCIGIRPQLPATSTYKDAMVRLADLIDRPTCSIKRESRNGYPTTWGVCSRCGAIVNAERAVSNATEYLPTRYCPNCGAEVMD